MTRRKSLLLAAFAVFGAAATVLLLALVASEDAPQRERAIPIAAAPGQGTLDAAGTGSPDGPRVGGRVTWEQRHDGAPYQVVDGDREARDSPEYRALVAQRGVRVLEIIEEVRGSPPEDAAKRNALYRELQSLMRQLGSRVDPAVRDQLVTMLFEVEDRWRPLIGGALGELKGDVETAKKLVGLLQQADSNVFTRSAILTALGNMQVREIVPDLIARLGEGYEGEELILRTIGQLADTGVRLKLLDRLKGPIRPESQREIVNVLGQCGDPQVIAKLVERLGEADAKEKGVLVQILALTRDPAHAEAVAQLTRPGVDEQVRQQAIRALGMFGDAASGERLLDLVQHGSDLDRIWATSAIHSIRNPETLEALAAGWESLDENGRLAVVGAGKNLPRPGGKLVDVALEGVLDNNRRVRTASAILLGRSHDERAVEPLVRLLETSTQMGERSTAVAALLNLGTKEAAERGLATLHVIPNEQQRESYADQFRKVLTRLENRER